MNFDFVTDELSQDPRRAVETAPAWGVRLPRHTDRPLEDLAALRGEYGIRYTAVSPGFLKCHLDDRGSVDYALGPGLDLTMDFMEWCGVQCHYTVSYPAIWVPCRRRPPQVRT